MSAGIGVFLAPNQSGQYVVTQVVPGGPAANSGNVQVGDILLRLDGVPLEGQSVEGVKSLIIGPVGAAVDVNLQRYDRSGRSTMIFVSLIRGNAGPSRDTSPMRYSSPAFGRPFGMVETPPCLRPYLGAPDDRRWQATPGMQHPWPSPGARPQQRSLSPIMRPGPIYGSGRLSQSSPGLQRMGASPFAQRLHAGTPPFGPYDPRIRGETPVRGRTPGPALQYPPHMAASPSPMQMGSSRGPSPFHQPQGGLGLTLRNDVNGDLRITEVYPGGPAHREGTLRRGDILASVDGVSVRGMTVTEARDYIMGPDGSQAMVNALREPFNEPSSMVQSLTVALQRGIVPASRERASLSPMPHRGYSSQNPSPARVPRVGPAWGHPGPAAPALVGTPSPAPMGWVQETPAADKGGRMSVNEGMCGIGVFIQRTEQGLLIIKHINPDGPSRSVPEIQVDDFLVAIDGHSTEGMPMHQVRNMIVGPRGTAVRLTLRRQLTDPQTGFKTAALSPIFDVMIRREPPLSLVNAARGGPGDSPPWMQGRAASGNSPNTNAWGQAEAPPPPPQQPRVLHTPAQPQAPPPPPGMEEECSVGLNLVEFDGALIIQKVYQGGPAERSGLVMKGDLLHRLDYRTVSEMTVGDVVPFLRGPHKSSVVLGLIKPKFRLRVNVRLQREFVPEEHAETTQQLQKAVDKGRAFEEPPQTLLKPSAGGGVPQVIGHGGGVAAKRGQQGERDGRGQDGGGGGEEAGGSQSAQGGWAGEHGGQDRRGPPPASANGPHGAAEREGGLFPPPPPVSNSSSTSAPFLSMGAGSQLHAAPAPPPPVPAGDTGRAAGMQWPRSGPDVVL